VIFGCGRADKDSTQKDRKGYLSLHFKDFSSMPFLLFS